MLSLPTFDYEKELWNKGYELVIGVDEVGRGCFAGPVVAAAVAFPSLVTASTSKRSLRNFLPSVQHGIKIDDSKRLKPNQRKQSANWIKEHSLAFGIGEVNVGTINRVGIGKAGALAMRKAIRELLDCYIVKIVKKQNNSAIQQYNNCFVLIDAFSIKYLHGIGLSHQKPIIKGDQKSISIAAASIVAKVYRDSLMQKLSKQYELYGWGRNKGYGTKDHQEAIVKNGITSFHRTAFVETFLSSSGR